MPWPNRVRDGRYSFGGREHQLALTEPKRYHASHGLARWAAWTLEEHTANSVSLVYRVMAQTGYPWAVDLHVLYDLGADGLTVTQTATNLSGEPAPYACGAHPYLCVGEGIDHLELTVPAGTRTLTDDRLIPVETVAVDDEHDFRTSRAIGTTAFNETYGDLSRTDGVATATLRDPVAGHGVALWVDERIPWLLLYSADDAPGLERRSLAVEPMTAPVDAFNSGTDLVTLAPAGEPGDELSVTWGIRALGHGRRGRLTGPGSAVDQCTQTAYGVAGAVAVGALDRQHGHGRAVGQVEGRPRGSAREPDRDDLRPVVDVAPVAVDHRQAGLLRHDPGPGQGVAHGGVQQSEGDQRGPLEEREAGAHRRVEAEPRERADHHEHAAEEEHGEPDPERSPGAREGDRCPLRCGRHGCR